MQRAILFWCYRDLALCRSRLRLLRHFDPDAPIYVLYGGPIGRADAFAEALGPLADDFWAFDERRPRSWKWRHGNLMIRKWHIDRGRYLPWDTVVVAQWDLLMFGGVEALFPTLGPDELLISGLRPLHEVEAWWPWVRPDRPRERARYEAFLASLRRRHGAALDDHLRCGLFVVVCLPRSFLEAYGRYADAEEGFLEYSVPTLASLWGHAFCTDHPHRPWWRGDPAAAAPAPRERVLNAGAEVPRRRTILGELLRPRGRRIFHPYRRECPVRVPRGAPPWTLFVAGNLGAPRA